MVRNPRGRKTSSRSPRQRSASSRKAQAHKTRSRKAQDGRTGSNAELEMLRTEIRSSSERISEIERRLEETDQATKNAISRFSQIIGELNVRLTSVAANVFEVIAMAKASAAADGPQQTFQLRSKLDGEIKR
jgi:predicted  nucleic acid-binding Zn-ribbon protein